MGTNLQGYHLLWPDLPTFSQLQFPAPLRLRNRPKWLESLLSFEAVACWFFHHPIHNKSNETWRKRSEHFAEVFIRVCFSSNPQSALARRY